MLLVEPVGALAALGFEGLDDSVQWSVSPRSKHRFFPADPLPNIADHDGRVESPVMRGLRERVAVRFRLVGAHRFTARRSRGKSAAACAAGRPAWTGEGTPWLSSSLSA